MIEWAKENGCTIYDFRGVSGDLNPKNPLYGLYRFKKGFGGEFTEFIGEYDLPFSKPLYFLWEKGIPLYREARRKMINLIRKFNK
jgi:lipid II:glycine glycyltransferase (peptidoglycan interpeptide bridge formation enzyme)